MIIVIHRSAQRLERAQVLTLLCQVRGCQQPIATTTIHQHGAIAPDRKVHAAQASPLISQQSDVKHLLPIKTPYMLVSQVFQATNSSIVVGDALGSRPVVIGKGTPTIMAGPCAIATREHLLAPAHVGQATGAFNPHTSPSQFQGRSVEGQQLLAEARNATGLPSITAVMEPGVVETMVASADGLQVGSRTRHHFPLLVAAGQHRSVRPVLFTRWLSVTIPAGRPSAASLLAASHSTVIFCECGRHGLDRKPVSYA